MPLKKHRGPGSLRDRILSVVERGRHQRSLRDRSGLRPRLGSSAELASACVRARFTLADTQRSRAENPSSAQLLQKGKLKMEVVCWSEALLGDMNDEINKLIREKGHWERRILALGGPNYMTQSRKVGHRVNTASENASRHSPLFQILDCGGGTQNTNIQRSESCHCVRLCHVCGGTNNTRACRVIRFTTCSRSLVC
jgi:hypothetical protein